MRLISKVVDSQNSSSSILTSYSFSKSESSRYISSSDLATTTPWPTNIKNQGLQKSKTTSSVIETKRGFKPSDFKDPLKKEFLTNLTRRVFKIDMDENTRPSEPFNLEKALRPASEEYDKGNTNKKIFASSAFYAKGFHPTMEEQVELAKRISSSLSDISNKTSKGQSMFINRKKRSVKWVHEGEGERENGSEYSSTSSHAKKNPLKLVMNPHGQVQDLNSLKKQGYSIESALSPDVCLEIVKDLNSPKGKGAELFAKRRKHAENWIVSESTGTKENSKENIVGSSSTDFTTAPLNSSFLSSSHLPETIQGIQHNEKLSEIQDNFSRPRVKLIKSPWDAALETGSVDAAFENIPPAWPSRGSFVAPAVESYELASDTDNLASWVGPRYNGHSDHNKIFAHNPAYNSASINRIVDNIQKGTSNVNVYKPKLPSAWNGTGKHQLQCVQSSQVESDIGASAEAFTTDKSSEEITFLSSQPEIPTPHPIKSESILHCSHPYVEPNRGDIENFDEIKNQMAEKHNQSIPDVRINENEITDDFEKLQVDKPDIISQPTSSFPSIPDITVNPEIIENDIIFLRKSPTAFYSQPLQDSENNCNERISENFSALNLKKKYNRKYEPVSFTEKQYHLQNPLTHSPKNEKPEFQFALNDSHSTTETCFSNVNADKRLIRSEMFQVDGHFVADRTSAPLCVFIPNETSDMKTSILKNLVDCTEIYDSTKNENNETEDSEVKEHITNSKVTGNKEKQNITQCYSELRATEIQCASTGLCKHLEKNDQIKSDNKVHSFNEQNVDLDIHESAFEDSAENFHDNIHFLGQKTDAILHDDESNQHIKNGGRKFEMLSEQKNMRELMELKNIERKIEIQFQSEETNKNINTQNYPGESLLPVNVNVNIESSIETKKDKIPKPICKKAPETVIGARPLFGQLDINSEFKKALTGRQKSMGNKKNREIYKSSQKYVEPEAKKNDIIIARPCGNFQTSTSANRTDKDAKLSFTQDSIVNDPSSFSQKHEKQIHNFEVSKGSHECIYDYTELSSQFKKDESAQIEIFKPSEDEEIQKVYYQRERALSIDFQTVSGELQQNDIEDIIDKEVSKYVNTPSHMTQYNNTQNTSEMKPEFESSIRNRPEFEHNKIIADERYSREYNIPSQQYEYQKIPVRAIIENFELNSMPPLMIREFDYTDGAYSLPPETDQNFQSEVFEFDLEGKEERNTNNHQEAKFQKNYYTANAQVQTSYEIFTSSENNFQETDINFPTSNEKYSISVYDGNKENLFQQSENSSFYKYPSSITTSPSGPSASENNGTVSASAFKTELLQDSAPSVKAVASPTPQKFVPVTSQNHLLSSYNSTMCNVQPIPTVTVNTFYEEPQKNETVSSSYATKPFNFRGLQNYNTAPRGWNQSKNVYKPITFNIEPYSDF